ARDDDRGRGRDRRRRRARHGEALAGPGRRRPWTRSGRLGEGKGPSDAVRSRPVPVTDNKVRDEDDLNRELIELLNELRVALPGVQVLFAFLLIVPFSNGWDKVTEVQRYVYFVAFLCAAISSAF